MKRSRQNNSLHSPTVPASGDLKLPTFQPGYHIHIMCLNSPQGLFSRQICLITQYSFTLSVSITSYVNEFNNGIIHHEENKKQNLPLLLSQLLASYFHQIPLFTAFMKSNSLTPFFVLIIILSQFHYINDEESQKNCVAWVLYLFFLNLLYILYLSHCTWYPFNSIMASIRSASYHI